MRDALDERNTAQPRDAWGETPGSGHVDSPTPASPGGVSAPGPSLGERTSR
jgi:hypothetical protein